jgi:hypothetical protein
VSAMNPLQAPRYRGLHGVSAPRATAVTRMLADWCVPTRISCARRQLSGGGRVGAGRHAQDADLGAVRGGAAADEPVGRKVLSENPRLVIRVSSKDTAATGHRPRAQARIPCELPCKRLCRLGRTGITMSRASCRAAAV